MFETELPTLLKGIRIMNVERIGTHIAGINAVTVIVLQRRSHVVGLRLKLIETPDIKILNNAPERRIKLKHAQAMITARR